RISALLILCCSISGAEEIPLSEVWGYQIGRTRDVKELEPGIDLKLLNRDEIFRQSKVQQIRRALNSSSRHRNEGDAGEAFVVSGTGAIALKKAHAVLVGGECRADSFNTE